VQVRVLLRQDGNTIGVAQVEGRRDQLDILADQLATAIAAKAKVDPATAQTLNAEAQGVIDSINAIGATATDTTA